VKPGEAGPLQPKKNIHCAKIMLCIWWDQKGIVHYELLKPSDAITGDVYRRQLMRLKVAIKEKRPEWVNKHSKLIFQHDNAAYCKSRENIFKWTGLGSATPPAIFARHSSFRLLFIYCIVSGRCSQILQESDLLLTKTSNFGLIIGSKDQDFFRQGIRKLPER